LAYLTWALVSSDRKAILAVQSNLSQGLAQGGGVSMKRAPVLLQVSKKLLPTGYEAKLDRWLSLAGRPAALPLDRVIIAKPALAFAGAAFGLLLYANSRTSQSIALALFITIFFFFVPDLLIYNKGIKRQKEIELELPNTLDQMLISV